jgi:hypothetical protein
VLSVTRLVITLPMPGRYAFRAELQAADGGWADLLDEPLRDALQATVELPTPSLTGRKVRLRVRSASGGPACVAEMRVAGRLNSP